MNRISHHTARPHVRLFAALAALMLMSGLVVVASPDVRAAAIKKAVKKVTVVPFKLGSTNSLVAVAPGTIATTTITSTRSKGFTGSIYLGVSGVPKGVTVRAEPSPLTTKSTSKRITISPSSTFAPRTFSITVSGSSKGKTSRVVIRVAVGSFAVPTTLAPLPPAPAPTPASTTTPPSTTTTTVALSDYTLSVEPTSISLSTGGSATATLRINRTGGFNQPLTATLANLPTGMTGSVDEISGTAATSTIRLAASASVANGTYDITVSARGRSAVLRVFVSGNALTASPSALTVSPGAGASATLSLTRPVTASLVTWSVDVLPVGLTASFNPNGTTAVSTVMTVAATAAAGAGSYVVTLRASSDGGSVTSPFTLTVTSSSFGAAVVTPASLTLLPGGNTAVTITPPTLPAGIPTLSVTGLPAGTAAVISISGASFVYNFSLPPATAVGTYPVTFQVLQGGATASGSFTLVVSLVAPTTTTVPPVSTSFDVFVSPVSLSIARGASGLVTIPVSWTAGVTQQPILFATTGGPVGMGISYTVNPSALGTTLNLVVPAGAATGAYVLTVSGTVAGLGTASKTVTLTVT